MESRIRTCETPEADAARAPVSRPAANRRRRTGENGFTLAGLIVILTIIAIFIAYTVPPQWSKIMQREREKQTIFVMKQYARAIREWSKKNGANPVKIDQLKEARLPRVMRGPKGELVDPLTGKVDWILIPPGAITQTANTGGAIPGGMPGGTTTSGTSTPSGTTSTGGTTDTTGTGAAGGKTQFNAAASPRDYVGPFVGVRPPVSGHAMLTFQNSEDYSQWYYTITDLDNEIKLATTPNPNAH